MKGEKDEEKVMGPLFPRLHVNDTEKRGLRAPPRNKMALYEQLSIPSRRLNSPKASAVPPNSHKANTLVASASPSQGGSCERSVFSPFYVPPPTTTHCIEKIHPHSSDEMNLNATSLRFERNSTRKTSCKASNATGCLSSTTECSIFYEHDISNTKNSRGKKIRYEDDFVVPTYVHSGISCGSKMDLHGGNGESSTASSVYPGQSTAIAGISPQKSMAIASNSSIQLQNTHDKSLKEINTTDLKLRKHERTLKEINTTDLKLRKHERNPSEEKPKETVAIRDHYEKSGPHQSTGKYIAESFCHVGSSLDQVHHSSSVNEVGSLQNRNPQLCQETGAGLLQENNCSDENGVAERENASSDRSERCSTDSLEKCPNEVENCSGEFEEKAREAIQEGDRNDDISETSMVDSISRFEISPDDVVGVIGQKNFWEARREIANQQRVFAVQVFELHRLIKVQKQISASPDLLLESNSYLVRPSLMARDKNQPSEYLLKSRPHVVRKKNYSQKPSKMADHLTDNAVRKRPPVPTLNDSSNQVHVNQHSGSDPCYVNAPAAPMATNNKSGAWYFHPPPGNQWLIPVMSPLEGLVYKPYTGSCPPTADFMAPFYGGCGRVSLCPDPAFGMPASHHFPPHVLPVTNPMTPVVEQVNPSGGARTPHRQEERMSMGEVNFNMQSGSSCNVSNKKSEAFSCRIRRFQTSKDSELQDNLVSSPCVRVPGDHHDAEGCDMLPLFPMAPAAKCLDRSVQVPSSDQQIHVIKVVPHDARSATESAARIFRSIQKERQQYNSL